MEIRRDNIKAWLTLLFFSAVNLPCRADAFIIAPTPPPGPVTGPGYIETFFPFFLQQIQLSSMRYQQVYNASVFSNVPPECIYVTTLTFVQGFTQQGSTLLTVTNMQINLSTTQRGADNLSTNFAENVGPDDTVVFGPARHDFNDVASDKFQILLDRPFRYNPAAGNLLLDVRIFNGAGPVAPNRPRLEAYNSSTDESSRVLATNASAFVADGADTTGLDTVVQFSPAPSLVIYTSGTTNTPTNYIVIDWPSEPSVFRLQQSARLGTGAMWQTVSNANAPRYYFPVESSGSVGYYRLVWESGQAAQSATAPLISAKPGEKVQAK